MESFTANAFPHLGDDHDARAGMYSYACTAHADVFTSSLVLVYVSRNADLSMQLRLEPMSQSNRFVCYHIVFRTIYNCVT